MHHHTGRLVDHEHVVVLVHDVERDVLAEYFTPRRRRNLDRDWLTRPRTITGALSATGDENVSLGDQRRGLIAGDVEVRGDEDVETRCLVRRVDAVVRGRHSPTTTNALRRPRVT